MGDFVVRTLIFKTVKEHFISGYDVYTVDEVLIFCLRVVAHSHN